MILSFMLVSYCMICQPNIFSRQYSFSFIIYDFFVARLFILLLPSHVETFKRRKKNKIFFFYHTCIGENGFFFNRFYFRIINTQGEFCIKTSLYCKIGGFLGGIIKCIHSKLSIYKIMNINSKLHSEKKFYFITGL